MSGAVARQRAGIEVLGGREPDEWQDGDIPGAMLIPRGDLARRAAEGERSRAAVAGTRLAA